MKARIYVKANVNTYEAKVIIKASPKAAGAY
jgi:hypothetical protein